MNIQWDLVIPNFKDPKTIALVRGKVEDASFGSSSHRAGVLKVALKKVFELKRRNRQPTGLPILTGSVLLRCPITSCTWYKNPFSRGAAGSNISCQCHIELGARVCYFQCTSCGFNRTSNYASCQNCRREFA